MLHVYLLIGDWSVQLRIELPVMAAVIVGAACCCALGSVVVA
jgi:hypothetical protein